MKLKWLWLVIGAAVIAALVCGLVFGLRSGREVNVSGKWEFTLTPFFQPGDSENATVREVDLYDYDGTIAGFSAPFYFSGTRTGDVVNLEVFEGSGLKGVAHGATMNLKWNTSNHMVGDSTSLHADVEPDSAMSAVSAQRIGDAPSLQDEAQLGSWIDNVLNYVLNHYAIPEMLYGSTTKLEPMNYGDVQQDGRGYYMMGNEGPGSGQSAATYTFYYPLNWGHGGVSTYGFTFHSQSVCTSIDDLVSNLQINLGDGYAKDSLGFTGTADLVSAVRNFYAQYGDFAITVVDDDYNAHKGIYVNLADASKSAGALNDRLIQTLQAHLQSGGVTVYLYCGHDIYDTWQLKRPYVLVDGTCLFIGYTLGTINVWYD